ncbi:thyroid transcription factor 1-associated protein 26 [Engystomops pustulosus]|uniref:thyroid transcription factor 1-associated protein 26 n=1 Tax=Engystomops pustulosus TaxID=76066 RepID=UPI003AFA40CE
MIVDGTCKAISRSRNMAPTTNYKKGNQVFGSKGGAASAGGKRHFPGNKGENRSSQGGRIDVHKTPTFKDKGSGKAKRKWWPNADGNMFVGSTREGQGFAFWRKKKVELQYKKLQRKQKKENTKKDFSDHYPEHLKHLYLVEEERLKIQENRRRLKRKASEGVDEEHGKPDGMSSDTVDGEPGKSSETVGVEHAKRETKPSEKVDEDHENLEKNPSQTEENERGTGEEKPTETADKEKELIKKKTFRKKTSLQKAREEYERVQQERAKKREEAELRRKQREEAQKLYKEKRAKTYKIIRSKTSKGQPNFNAQMDLLLKKIRSQSTAS